MNYKQKEQEAEDLAAVMPVGTRVIYFPGPRERGGRECEIRDGFHVNVNGRIMTKVTGTAGYVAADHVATLPAEQEVKPNG